MPRRGPRNFPRPTSRSYNYFTPAKRRATVYEDVTVDVQPDPERHLLQGWIYGFADGTGGYPQEWTALKSSNWHAFLDPNEEWEQTIYRNNANVVRQISQNLANAKAARAFEGWNSGWIKTVERHVSAWAHVEHGIGMHVYLPAQRDAPTNMINNALSVASAHKLRFGQDIILYNLELSDRSRASTARPTRTPGSTIPIWQGVRENVEKLTAIRDWAEAFFAAAVVFEPLVGELFRSEFVMQVAALQGDFVTPTLMGAGESDTARDLRVARRAVRDARRTTRSTASRTGRRCSPGWSSGRRSASPLPGHCSRSGRSRARRSSASRNLWSTPGGATRNFSPT